MADLDDFRPMNVQLQPYESVLISRHLAETKKAGLPVRHKASRRPLVTGSRSL